MGNIGNIYKDQCDYSKAYALADLEDRGIMFVTPGMATYPGMIIGECNREIDIRVNPCRVKVLSNVRQANKEGFFKLKPPLLMSLEEMISYVKGIKLNNNIRWNY